MNVEDEIFSNFSFDYEYLSYERVNHLNVKRVAKECIYGEVLKENKMSCIKLKVVHNYDKAKLGRF